MDVAIRRCGPFFVKMLFLPNHLWYTVGNSGFNRKVPAGEGIKSEEAELPGKRAREEKVGQSPVSTGKYLPAQIFYSKKAELLCTG